MIMTKIFTRWNAKAWPTMIAMEGSILDFLPVSLCLRWSQVVHQVVRWLWPDEFWSDCSRCTAGWWKFNMWWRPGGAWWWSCQLGVGGPAGGGCGGSTDGGGGGGVSRGAEGCLYATRALIYRQAPETDEFYYSFCSHYLTTFLKLRNQLSELEFHNHIPQMKDNQYYWDFPFCDRGL